MGEEYPYERPRDGVDRDARLVGQHGKLEQPLHQWPRRRPSGLDKVCRERHVVGLAQKVEQAGQQGGQERRQNDQSRSRHALPQRARQPGPDKQAEHRRRHEAPAEVVEDLPLGEE